jgi:serine protease
VRIRLHAIGVSLCAAFAFAAPAHGAASPAETCQSSQLRAGARFFQKELRCFAAYYKAGALDAAERDACRNDAAAAFTTAYERAVATAGPNVCTLQIAAATLVGNLQDDTDGLVNDVSGAFADTGKAVRSLHGSLLGATGSMLSAALNVESRDAKKSDEVKRVAGRGKASSKLLASFAKALDRASVAGVSYSGDDGNAVAATVNAIVDGLAADTAPAFHALSGVVQAAAGSVVDSDVNDPNAPPVPNNTLQTAQAVPVPAAVGGYVNLPGFGPPGSLQSVGDSRDLFRVSLAAGQRVNLRFANPLETDLDLVLYDGAGVELDRSEGVAETEELFAPSSGEFVVEVFVFPSLTTRASSYVLTLGQNIASAGPAGVRLSDEFVPGELIVALDAKAAVLSAGAPPTAAAVAASLGLEAAAGAADREMLFRLPASGAARAAVLATLGGEPAAEALAQRRAALSDEERAKHDTLLAMKALRGRPDVALVEPNYIRRAQATPNDTHFGLQWHYPLINLPAAWDVETGSASVEVAVIDTGVLFGHPDLDDGQLSTSADFDFVSSVSQSLDGNGIDADASDPGDGAGVQPSSFHGTHVAGTIGASTNNGSGVAGVAHAVTIIPLRALGRFGSGTSFDILQAVRYAGGLPNDSGVQRPAVDIINLSLGGSGSSQAEQNVYTDVRNAGVIVIAAAGNNNSSQLFFPASYTGVVSVSAVETRRQKAPYSNFGSAVDVAAPGGDTSVDRNGDGYADGVLSTLADEGSQAFVYAFYQGTSMASPHMAGVAALMKSADPGMTPAEFDAFLSSGALTNDLGSAGRDDVFGHGLIDARKAVEAAGAGSSNEPFLLVNPTSLNLGTTLTTASFEVSNGGGGTLTITDVEATEPWLTVSGSGLGSYTVNVNRSGLDDGTYTGTITVTSAEDGSETVSVVMSVLSSSSAANAGFHYVLLLDPDTFDPVAQFDAAALAGQYAYALDQIPSGTYVLFAGNDSDNDLFICGTGEACGAFPTLGRPELVTITGDRSDLDFVSSFLQTLEAPGASASDAPLPRQGIRRLGGRRLAP